MSSETYPLFPPELPKQLHGIASVDGKDGNVYTVDFDKCECDCQYGKAWKWSNKRWVQAPFCQHKLKAVASLIEAGDESLRDFYETQVGKRYNPFETVSAFHKELRRGDKDKALYWATVLIPHRGRHNVVRYMLNIVFEETRDLPLARYLLKVCSHGKSVSPLDMQRAVCRFCEAPKKWELPWRLDIFIDEQKAYRELAKRYGYEVAKPHSIIAEKEVPKLEASLLSGFETADRVAVQVGVKGLLKAKVPEEYRIDLFNTLTDVLNGAHKNKFEHDETYCNRLHDMLHRKIVGHGAPHYHDINAFADALTGEPGGTAPATLPAASHKRITNNPRLYRMPLGEMRRLPLYAHDNHTWRGKSLMRNYAETELQPGAEQAHMDFRLWGAYGGVAWRLLAIKQHGTIDCKWGDVSWRHPNWLWKHVSQMNY